RRHERPMSLGFAPHHPGGMVENSPTFQRWALDRQSAQVPKGRLKLCPRSAPVQILCRKLCRKLCRIQPKYEDSTKDGDKVSDKVELFGTSLARACPREPVNPTLSPHFIPYFIENCRKSLPSDNVDI